MSAFLVRINYKPHGKTTFDYYIDGGRVDRRTFDAAVAVHRSICDAVREAARG